MKVTILANCSRCGEQFILPGETGKSVLPVNGYPSVIFKPDDKLVRHKYVSGLEIDKFGRIDTTESEVVSFCQACDAEYWKNFDDAVKVLEAFWHDPLREEIS